MRSIAALGDGVTEIATIPYLNRELSMLDFHARVLHQAQDARAPLLERVRFVEEIFPVLTPLAVDPGHRFPYISSLSLSIAVLVREPEGVDRFARVKVPSTLPRMIEVEPGVYVFLEEVIRANLDLLFSGLE